MMNVCLMFAPILAFIPSPRVDFVRWTHDERTINVRPSHDSLAYLASRKNVLRFLCGSLAAVLRITRLPHGCLAAAVRILRFSFPTIKLRTSHDLQGSRTRVALLPCDVYDKIGPVWIFAKLSAICLRHAAPAKSYVKLVARLMWNRLKQGVNATCSRPQRTAPWLELEPGTP